MPAQDPQALERESLRFTRYLLGVDPPRRLAERYCRANEILFSDPPTPADRELLDFVDRRPWTLPFVESALGLVRPQSLLRRKMIVMLAILETTPELSARFDAEPAGRVRLAALLARLGLTAAIKTGVGLLIYPFIRKRE